MDQRFHRDSALNNLREETFLKNIHAELFDETCSKILALRKHFSEEGEHPAKRYFKTNKMHLTVYIRRLLTITLDCYTHDRRCSLPFVLKKGEIWRSGVLWQCVNNHYLTVKTR